ncbi:MAG: AAA family ATPase [Dehalococcoidia bacterium]
MTSRFSRPVVCPDLVGREAALEWLRLTYAGAARRGCVALVSGEAGIGKTRLVAAFLDEAVEAGRFTARARFFSDDAALPFSGIARLILELGHTEPERGGVVGPVADELARNAPELARLLGVGRGASTAPGVEDADPARRRRNIELVALLLVANLPAGGAVLAIDDVHWADTTSLETLLHFARAMPGGCLLVLTYRNDEQSGALRALLADLDRERVATEIELGPLSAGEVERMVRATVQLDAGGQPSLMRLVHTLSEGNPFLVEEILRTVVDVAGAVQRVPSVDLAALDVPRSVDELVRRRMESLADDDIEIVRLAAIAGQRVDLALMAELTGHDEARLLGAMRRCIEAQLVTEEASGAFVFRHALTREAIRSRVLRRERRAISARIARALELRMSGGGDDGVEELAQHWYEAEEWEQAHTHGVRAGLRALGLAAPEEALAHFERALAAGEQAAVGDLSAVRRLRGTAFEGLGDFEAARRDYEAAVGDGERAGNTRETWRALLDLGLLWAARDYGRSEPYFRRALAIARETGDAEAIGHSLNRLANWFSNTGDAGSAVRLHEEALGIFRRRGDRAGEAQTLDLLGMACTQQMDFVGAARHYREAIPLLEEARDRETLSSALASIQIGSGTRQSDMTTPALTLREGSDYGRYALRIAREAGRRPSEAYALWQLAFSLGPQGLYDEALAGAEGALRIAQEIGHTQWEIAARCVRGALMTDLLAFERARRSLERAAEQAAAMSSGLWLAQAQALLIDALVASGEREAAVRLFEATKTAEPGAFGMRQCFASGVEALLAVGAVGRASAMLDALEAATSPAGALVALRLAYLRGRILAASGDETAAVGELEAAAAAARVQGDRSYEWRLECELAGTRAAAGDPEGARAAGRRAAAAIDEVAAKVGDPELQAGFLRGAYARLPASVRPNRARDGSGPLTSRESEIAELIAAGLTNRAIAERLVLSPRTVESHIAHAMGKLGFSARAQLAGWVVERRGAQASRRSGTGDGGEDQ